MADPFELRRIADDLCRRDFPSFAIRAFPVMEGDSLELSHHINIICRPLEKVYDGEVRLGLHTSSLFEDLSDFDRIYSLAAH